MNDLGLEYSQNDLELCKVGDPASCLRFLHFLKQSYEQSINLKIAPSAEKMDISDIKDIKKETDKVIEPIVEADYVVSQVLVMYNH